MTHAVLGRFGANHACFGGHALLRPISMNIAVVHNLPPGGAHRRLASQLNHLNGDVVEICLQTATPITPDTVIVPFRPLAPGRHRILRPPLRYVDLARLELAWRMAAAAIRRSGADVIYLNPCRFLQGPPVLGAGMPPALYFCDEPRRIDSEADAAASRNRSTRGLYATLYSRQTRLDRTAAARATQLATNSRYTAGEIQRVYGRRAEVVTMGVPDSMLAAPADNTDDGFLLSVAALIPTKGHDLVLRAAGQARRRRRVVIVAPRAADAEEGRLRRLAAGLGIELDVRVGVTDQELGRLFQTAHATLYLARREPLGLVSLEAQACGSPVIVAAEGGLPETIIDGVTGWQVPREPLSVAAFLDRLADPDVRHSMSSQGRIHAQRWSWKQSAAEVETLLRELRGRSSVTTI